MERIIDKNIVPVYSIGTLVQIGRKVLKTPTEGMVYTLGLILVRCLKAGGKSPYGTFQVIGYTK